MYLNKWNGEAYTHSYDEVPCRHKWWKTTWSSMKKPNNGMWGGLKMRWVWSLCLRYRDGRAFGVIKAVHGVQLHDHVKAVGQHQNHQQGCKQPHPDARGEEAGAVARVWKVLPWHIKALDLKERERKESLVRNIIRTRDPNQFEKKSWNSILLGKTKLTVNRQ